MTSIQWLLLILIVAVVAGIYFYVRHQAADNPWEDMERDDAEDRGDSYIVGVRTVSDAEPGAAEPSDDKSSDGDKPQSAVAGADTAASKSEEPGSEDTAGKTAARQKPAARPPSGDEKFIVIHVACRGDEFFDGPDIHVALKKATLEFGAKDVFHRIDQKSGQSVFAVANMIKPGTLDPVDEDHLSTPGLTLFLALPGPWEGARALRDMLETSGVLAQHLGGEVLDDSRALLKPQNAQFMLDEVAEMDRKQRLQNSR